MTVPKAKRKLTNIDFSTEGSHIALVSKEQGGAANGHSYALVMKATGFSQEFVKKMQQVRVTMELPEFLTKFFYVYGSDAEVLARMMGYVDPDAADPTDATEDDPYETAYEQMIQDRLAQFDVLKSLHESKDLAKDLLALGEDGYLAVLKTQAKLEKVLNKIEKNFAKSQKASSEEGSTEAITIVKQSDDKSKVEPSKTVTKGRTNMEELEQVQKALADNQVALTKALEELAVFKAEKLEMIKKARLDKIKAAVKDETKVESLFKAFGLVESEEDFDAAVKVVADMQALVEKSALFTEQGSQVSTDETPVVESAVAKVIKAKLAKDAGK